MCLWTFNVNIRLTIRLTDGRGGTDAGELWRRPSWRNKHLEFDLSPLSLLNPSAAATSTVTFCNSLSDCWLEGNVLYFMSVQRRDEEEKMLQQNREKLSLW